jgi:hypothetical protein
VPNNLAKDIVMQQITCKNNISVLNIWDNGISVCFTDVTKRPEKSQRSGMTPSVRAGFNVYEVLGSSTRSDTDCAEMF